MKFLFWNTHNNNNINTILRDLIIENDISVVALAEYTANGDDLISMLSEYGKEIKQYITVGCEKIKIFGSLDNVEPGSQLSRASFQIIDKKYILCCVHLPSKTHEDHVERRGQSIDNIITEICKTESDLRIDNSIIVGDFNINPYDYECVSATLLHGIPIYHEAERKSRIYEDKTRYMFYNPMWNFLGDFSQPYGTYYHAGGNSYTTYWNIFDQVIIRPSLRKEFIDNSLRIITETHSTFLLNANGHPNKQISDHLPIVFEIQEENKHGKEIEFM